MTDGPKNKTTGSKKKPSLFDILFSATAEAIRKMKKPFIKGQIKRKLQSAYSHAAETAVNAEADIQKVRGDFEKYDVNKILELRRTIKTAKELQAEIKEEHLTLFSKEMVIEEEEEEEEDEMENETPAS